VSTARQYDAVIIGSGQAGTPLARALAQAGMRTALIEREHVGGTCINEGCTPTKTMIASGRVAYLARRAADYGVHTGAISIDFRKVRERKREMVSRFRNEGQARIEKTANLDLLWGEAKFAGPKSVELRLKDGAQQTISANYVFINIGTRASRPKVEGLESVRFLDNVSIMNLDAVPEHLLVLGGGYIGLEFAQLFRRFGSQVTVVHTRDQLLTHEDPDVAQELERILRQDGVEVFLNARPKQVRLEGKSIRLEIEQHAQAKTLFGSDLLAATGRVPNSDALNLSAAGIEADARGFIKVNDRLETSAPGIYALGDVKGGPAFTHISYDDFRIIRSNLLEKKPRTTANRLIPYVLFIDPQLGRVGLTETEARRQHQNVRVAKLPMSSVARALEVDESRGFIKAMVDADSKQILGAAVLGIEGGEVMAVFEMAMMGRLPYTSLRDGIFAHPTLAEALNNLFLSMEDGKDV
jgi:pyruvate/2-oxoglutarate dehydrogenase complex dihydrolipoamide dehydrogenase (E3) component